VNRWEERSEALQVVAVRHESDCGRPGVFSEVFSTATTWTAVIEHYDPERPLERSGAPCRYTAKHDWQVDRST
jgi:hypothetical protein